MSLQVDISSYSTFKEGKTEVDLLKQSIINAVMSVCRIGLQYHTSIQVDVFLALILNQQSLVLVSFGEMYECKSAKSLSGETSLETNESAFPFSLRQIPPEESQSKNNRYIRNYKIEGFIIFSENCSVNII